MAADLHLHTIHSDGLWTPEQVVEQARRHNLKCIAITDHDTVAGVAPALISAGESIEVIAGIEVNTVYATGTASERDVHILGYFLDTKNAVLQMLLQKQQQARQQLAQDVIAACRKKSVDLTDEHVAEFAGAGSIGRPHLCRAIVKAGGAHNADEAFDRFFSRASADYVPRRSVSPQQAISAIRDAGGIASLAHPGADNTAGGLIAELKENGLQAIEAYHRCHSLNLLKYYLRLAAKTGLLVTGGSDCHGPRDGYSPSIGTLRIPVDLVDRLKASLKIQPGKNLVALTEEAGKLPASRRNAPNVVYPRPIGRERLDTLR